MKIRATQCIAGADWVMNVGDDRDFPDGEAIRFIEAGYAVPVAEAKIERAVKVAAPEKRHPLDHDGDGKKGGSLPKEKRG